MKKILISSLCVGSFLFANTIKDNSWFVNVNAGGIDIQSSNSVIGVAAGYYFYDPNIYKINNRIYVDVQKVNSDADFYITSLKLDWIKNTSTHFAPFAGLNVGYLYFKNNGYDYSTNIWGAQAGILYEVIPNLRLNASFCYQKAYEKQNIWNTPLKTVKLGLEIGFD